MTDQGAWGIGAPDPIRGALDLIPGEPDRAEVMESISDWLVTAESYHDTIAHRVHDSNINTKGHIDVTVGDLVYELALVAVRTK